MAENSPPPEPDPGDRQARLARINRELARAALRLPGTVQHDQQFLRTSELLADELQKGGLVSHDPTAALDLADALGVIRGGLTHEQRLWLDWFCEYWLPKMASIDDTHGAVAAATRVLGWPYARTAQTQAAVLQRLQQYGREHTD